MAKLDSLRGFHGVKICSVSSTFSLASARSSGGVLGASSASAAASSVHPHFCRLGPLGASLASRWWRPQGRQLDVGGFLGHDCDIDGLK